MQSKLYNGEGGSIRVKTDVHLSPGHNSTVIGRDAVHADGKYYSSRVKQVFFQGQVPELGRSKAENEQLFAIDLDQDDLNP